MKKLVFLNPCNYNSPSNQSHGPLSFGYISSYLEKNLDEELDISIEVDVNQVIKKKPDIVGISSYTESYMDAIHSSVLLKKELGNKIPILLGGKHITALPKNFNNSFDIGVYGEGEQTTHELIQLYLKDKLNHDYLKNVDGIVYFNQNEKVINKPRTEIPSLDMLPKPNREIMHAYFPNINNEWYWPQAIYTSRGCPYVCHFCIHSTIKSRTRFHSYERIIEEIEDIIRLNPNQKNITIYDDLFVIDKKRVKRISELIVEEKLHKKVSFTCMGKADIFDEDFCSMLKKMNVKVMSFGFESGNQRILRYLKSDRSKVSDNQKVVDLCDKYGINLGGYFIVGSPNETIEELGQTYWFIRKNTPPMAMFGAFVLTPFPGTKFWDEAIEKNIVSENQQDWSKFSYIDFIEGNSFFFNESYSIEDFKRAYQSFYDLTPKNSVFILNNNEEQEIKYYDYVKSFIIKNTNVSTKTSVLEISNNYFPNFEYIFDNLTENNTFINSKVFQKRNTDISQILENELVNKKFDIIFFNHSIEQVFQPEILIEKVKYYLEDNGQIFILLKNMNNIYELANTILMNSNLNVLNFKPYDFFKIINIEYLKKIILTNKFQINDIQKVKSNTSSFNYIYNNILPLLKNYINKDTLQTLEIGSYLISINKNLN